MKHRLKHRIEYSVLRAGTGLLKLLPRPAALLLGEATAALLYYIIRFRTAEALRRIREVFPGKSRAEVRRIARRSLRTLCLNVVELARLGPRELQRITRLPGYQPIRAFHEQHQKQFGEKAFIFATIHLSNWEQAGLAAHLQGVPLFSIARRQRNPLTDAWLNRLRSITGMETVLNDSKVLRNVIKNLKAGRALAILPDVRSRTKALTVDYLGKPANLGAGMALFARQANVPIYPAVQLRTGWNRVRVIIQDPVLPDPAADKTADWQRMTQEVMDRFTELVRAYPEQYFWYNKRWVLQPLRGKPPAG